MTEEQQMKVKELLEKYNDILLVSMRLAVAEDFVNLIIQNRDDTDFSLSNLLEDKQALSDYIMREFLKQNSSSVVGRVVQNGREEVDHSETNENSIRYMTQLPGDDKVDVGRLRSVFRNTSATYKFYWFLAIIECVEEGKENIPKMELFARMLSNAWYTVNYFHVSYGKQDKIQAAIEKIKGLESIDIDASKNKITKTLLTGHANETAKQLRHFNTNVPHKFLSPWLGAESKGLMYELSQQGMNYPPYALYDDTILIQPDWVRYFKRNAGLLKDFCYWNLALFLQARNPNVPDIPNKLKRPEKRGSLSKHKRNFWDIVIDELKGVECIYTGRKLHHGDYAVEHFIPFQFVAHDQMWNLIPADPSFNSSKGDKLPSLKKYFLPFYQLQSTAIEIVQQADPKNKFLEDYITVFHGLNVSEKQYKECIEPMLTIANNNGFQFMS